MNLEAHPYAPPGPAAMASDHPGARAVPWTAATLRRTHRRFVIFHWIGCALYAVGGALLAVGIVLLFMKVGARGLADPASGQAAGGNALASLLPWLIPGELLLLVGCGLLITAVVFAMIQIFRLWTIVQRVGGPTTPGKAVGFLFIPFFNLYWVFVAFRGLAAEIDAAAAAAGSPQRLGTGLATGFGVLFVCGCVPYLGLLAFIPMAIVIPILMRRLAEGAIRLLPEATDPSHA